MPLETDKNLKSLTSSLNLRMEELDSKRHHTTQKNPEQEVPDGEVVRNVRRVAQCNQGLIPAHLLDISF